MDNKKPLYKNIYFWLLLLFFIYSIIGFFVVPRLIQSNLEEISRTELNSEIKIEKVNFNPYRFSTDIYNISIKDIDDNMSWFIADHMHANVSLFSSLFGNFKLSEISLDQPHYHFHLTDSGQLYPKLTPSTESQNSEVIALDIDQINLNKGALSYFDKSSDSVIQLKLHEIAFNHIGFTTDDKDSNFQVNFTTENNDKAEIKGQVNLAKMTINGNWKLANFTTETLFKFIADANDKFQGIENQSGTISANGSFQLEKANKLPTLKIENLQLTEFRSKDTSKSNEPQISVPHLTLSNASIDLNHQTAEIDSINTRQVNIQVSFDNDNNLIFNPSSHDNNSQDNQQEWNFTINQVTNTDSQILLNKVKNEKWSENSFLITSNKIENLTNKSQQQIKIQLSLIPDSKGLIKIDSSIETEPFLIRSNIDVSEIELASTQAWIPNEIQLVIESGQFSSHQNLILQNNQISSEGWLKLSQLNLLDRNRNTFLQVESLDLLESKVDSVTQTIDLNKIKITKANGNFSVSEESQLNLNTIIDDPPVQQQDNAEIDQTKDNWIINIKQVEMQDLQSNFTDRSIKPNYHTELTQINGFINDLSSENTSKADIDISGVLDTYGKISIIGQINPLSEKAFTDLNINIQNIDLQNFNTYSSEYIGFPIKKGKADFKLKYKLNQNLLEGVNDLEFKQLELGDKIQKQGGINLPLKLAMALLTDSNGVMPIYLPVSGKIDDPEFSYGGLVFKAFFKLITGIVASPFKLLGKLVPGGDQLDMSGVHFVAGTDELLESEMDKVKAMQQILVKRPNIILELSGIVNKFEDKKMIQQNLLFKKLNIDMKPDLSDSNQLDKIRNQYKTIFSETMWQDLLKNATSENGVNHLSLMENAWTAMLDSLSDEASIELDLLAHKRAQKIQKMLIEEFKIQEKRIFLKTHKQSEDLIPQVKFGITN